MRAMLCFDLTWAARILDGGDRGGQAGLFFFCFFFPPHRKYWETWPRIGTGTGNGNGNGNKGYLG